MRILRQSPWALCLSASILLGPALVVPGARAQGEGPTRVHSGSGGQIPIDGAAALRIEGITGTLVLRGGRPGEVRYEARSLDDRREPRPIAVDRTAPSELRIGRLDSQSTERLLVEVAVGPQLALQVVARDSRIVVSGIAGSFDLTGERIDADVRGNYGPVRIEVSESTLKLDGTSSDVDLRGRTIEADLRNVGGTFALVVEASRVSVDGVGRDSDVDVDDTTLVLARTQGALRVEANGGSIELREPAGGVEARLEEAPLRLSGSAGTVQVETDAAVEFQNTAGHVRIDGYGGSVRGSGTTGPISISTSQAEVVLDSLGGAATVAGDGLSLRVSRTKSELRVEVVSSQVELQDIDGGTSVASEFGDVTVSRVAGGLDVNSRNGIVRVEAATGPVDVRADGDEVAVEWVEMPKDGEQIVENANGRIVVKLPARAVCRVEAESTYGNVTSAFGAIRKTGERSAAGMLNGGAQPFVKIRAGGDVELATAAAPAG